MSLSEAERRRQERRQRILNNQESRLQKILGPNARIPTSTEDGTSWNDFQQIDSNDGLNSLLPPPIPSGSTENPSGQVQHQPKSNVNFQPVQPASDSLPAAGAQEKSAGNPTTESPMKNITLRITRRQHHTFLFLLSVMLSVLRGSHFLLYLSLYELTLFFLHGSAPPPFYSTTNTLLTVVALFGMPERRRKFLQDFFLLLNWLTTDLTIFLTSALFPIVVTYLIKGQ